MSVLALRLSRMRQTTMAIAASYKQNIGMAKYQSSRTNLPKADMVASGAEAVRGALLVRS
jgi:hypothetical protein